jgi:hypothetical protein
VNLRRGLFRLWIVGSALFVLAVAFVGYGEIKKQFRETALPWATVGMRAAVAIGIPHPGAVWRCDWDRENAAHDNAILQHVIVVVAPLSGRLGSRGAFED